MSDVAAFVVKLGTLLQGRMTVRALGALLTLYRAGEPLRFGVLATKAKMSPPHTSQSLDVLEAMGFAERRGDPENGRIKLVVLLAPGRAFAERVAAQFAAARTGVIGGLPPTIRPDAKVDA